MDMEVLDNKVGDSTVTKSNKRRKRRAKKKRMETNGSQIMDQTCSNLEVPGTLRDCKIVTGDDLEKKCKIVTGDDLEKNRPRTDLSVLPLVEYPKTVSGSIESCPEVNPDAKRKKKRKRVKKVKSKDEDVIVDKNTTDIGATGNTAEGNNVAGKRRKRKKKKKTAKIKDETKRTDQLDGMLNLHLSDGQEVEGNLIKCECKAQESKLSTRKESFLLDLVLNRENVICPCIDAKPVDSSNAIEVSSNRIPSEVRCGSSLEPSKAEGEFVPLEIIQDRPSHSHVDGENENIKSGINEVNIEHTASTRKESSVSGFVLDKENLLSLCKEHRPTPNHLHGENETSKSTVNEVNIEHTSHKSQLSTRKETSLSAFVPDKGNLLDSCKDEETVDLHAVDDSSDRRSSELDKVRAGPSLEPMEVERKFVPLEIQNRPNLDPMDGKNETCESRINEVNKVDVATHHSSPVVKGSEFVSNDLGQHPRIAPPVACIKRKLLVLDVNGLLAHIVMPPPMDCTADAYISRRAIFRRPFCEDFLKFCFENFDVGIWSSRSKRIIDRVVCYLLGDKTDKLKFCWDMDHSTQTGFKTLENSHKPLVCKELSKIWENEDPNLPWKKGDYNESNTLLLDDSPYKALLNPLHTAIFPHSYHYEDKNDNSLGPGGDLRMYLEGLLTSENVQKYVEQHPFGQSAINENNLSWGFYSGVLQTLSNRMEHNNSTALPPLSSL